jgi:hypothetical protein
MAKEQFIPSSPRNYPVRPLNKGVVLNAPPQNLEDGAFLKSLNFVVKPEGLERRGATSKFAGDNLLDYPPGQLLTTLWKTDGNQEGLVVDSKFLYRLESSGYTGKYWTYDTGTVSTSAAVATGDGTTWTGQEIQNGDIMVLDADGSGDGPEEVEVDSVDNDTQITLTSTPSGTYGAGTDYEIRRAFGAGEPFLVDSVSVLNDTVYADGSRFLYHYDGTNFEDYNASETFIPHCVGYFKDRLFCGYTIESIEHKRSRIRWSGLGSSNFNSFDTASFIDLPYTSGYLQRIIPMGSILIAMFTDTLYQGRPTNDADLPVVFDPIETGGIGLTGMQAVCSWLDGLFFVGQDDIYFLSNSGIERIGTPVVKGTIEECENLWRVYAVPDPTHDRVVFGFPKDGNEIKELWSYSYKADAWSYEELTCETIRSMTFSDGITYGDLDTAGVLDTDSYTGWGEVYPTYGSMVDPGEYAPTFFYIAGGKTLTLTTSGSRDAGGTLISMELLTGDMDFDVPDQQKFVNRLTLKMEENVDEDVAFVVQCSKDRGSTWKSLGTLTVPSGSDEGKVDFRMRGSMLRFRLTSSSEVEPYTVSELVFRLKSGGLEVQGR